MDERRAKGLCFNCNDRFHRGHVCQSRLFLLVALNPDEEGDEAPELVTTEPPPTVEQSAITFHAFTGGTNPRTLRLTGKIGTVDIQILIDSGATHNFIQPKLCEKLHLPIQPTKPFQVMVGNGDRLACASYVAQLAVQIQKHTLLLDCYLLPIQGADVVLGIQWLETLGTCFINYKTMTMAFDGKEQRITLHGNSGATWKDLEELQKAYPDCNLEDKVLSRKGSIDKDPIVYTRRLK